MMFIRSERLFLRPAWPEDWDELFSRINDPRIVRNLSRVPWPYTPEDARAFVRRAQDRRFPNLMVTLPSGEGSTIVGNVALMSDRDRVELGYWIARQHWGLGFATEAVRAMIGVARALGHHKVVAAHCIDNYRSGKVLRKAGFHKTDKPDTSFEAGRDRPASVVTYAINLDVVHAGDPEGGDDGTPDRMAA